MSKKGVKSQGAAFNPLSKSWDTVSENAFIIAGYNKRKGGPGSEDKGDENIDPNIFCSNCLEQQLNPQKKAKIEKTNLVKKETILSFIERVLGKEFSKKVLVDIVFSEDGENATTIVGRPEVEGSSRKQMRHVTPCAFLVKVIESKVSESKGPKPFLKSIIDFVLMLLPEEEGAAISSKDLAGSSYNEIRADILHFSSKGLMEVDEEGSDKENVVGNQMHFISPDKRGRAFSKATTPSKLTKAIKEYKQSYKEFCRVAFDKLIEVCDSNSNDGTTAAEAIARMIFVLFNQRENAAYPTEGNTRQAEIRYYKNASDAKSSNGEYEVLTAKELHKKYTAQEDINNKARMVVCEGAQVKSSKKALDLLSKYIAAKSVSKDFYAKIYNEKCNQTIKLTNEILDPFDSKISLYNKGISGEVGLEEIYFQAAKHLFIVFDYKALEDIVFVPLRSKGKINAYNGASTNLVSKFSFMKGEQFREDTTQYVEGYNDKAVFRNEEQEELFGSKEIERLINLAKKIVAHGVICLLPFVRLREVESIKSILEKFGRLVAYEHSVDDKKLCKTVESELSDVIHSISSSASSSKRSSKIYFSREEESIKFSDILGSNMVSNAGDSPSASFEEKMSDCSLSSALQGDSHGCFTSEYML